MLIPRRIVSKDLPTVLSTGQITSLPTMDLRDGAKGMKSGFYQVSLGKAQIRFSLGLRTRKN